MFYDFMRKMGLFLFLSGVMLLFAHSAHAQSSLLFTVSPARQQIVANPGEEFPVAVTFYNQGKNSVSGFIKNADFIVEDDKGTPTIIESAANTSPKYSAASWITLPYDRASIGGNDKVVVYTTLKIPKDAKPGGRYAAIFFEPITSTLQAGEAGASITPRIASLLYILVAGPIKEYAFISSMFSKSFYEYGPIEVTAKILNQSDNHIRPRGSFVLSNPLGGKEEQITLKEANIFPETQFTFFTPIGQKWMLGNYKISLNAFYGSKEQSMERTISVWVAPWRVIAISFLSVIILSILGRYFYKKFIRKETSLKSELSKEKKEIEKLKP